MKASINQPSLEEVADKWIKVFNELSYAGFQKQKIYEGFDKEFGEGNWLAAHFFEGKVISRLEAAHLYGEAYYQFLKANPDIREWIINTASDVYDIQPSNIESRLDYTKQECAATHLQDIAVRKALTRLKLEEQGIDYDLDNLPEIPIFEGDHLVQIRGHETEGYVLNPGRVPFHKPESILDTGQKGWWKKNSVEDFYQKNKVLLVHPERFSAKLAIVSPSTVFFEYDCQNYYSSGYSEHRLSDALTLMRGKDARRLYSQRDNGGFVEIRDSPVKSFFEWKTLISELKLPYEGPKHRIEFGDLSDGC